MYYRIIRNDILKSKATTLTTMIFVAAAAMLVALGVILVVNLSGSINTLMTRAKTPHFMQMHSGDIDTARLMAFSKQNDNVDQFQVQEFLNVDGARIKFGENSLANNVQDNGLSMQSEKFDYLLDLDGNVIHVSDGELYVPICYMKDNTTKVGDKSVILGKELTVAGFLRDSQMNSMLSSSKRFLVSKNDYSEIKSLGSMEYLIEFRLKDLSALGAFETAYTSAGLEANGPTITYGLFKMLNAISDGMMIAVILLVSALVVVLTTKTFKAKTEAGSEASIKTELGDHSIFPVKYSEGKAPAAVDDIALSAMNADELGKKVGDVMTLVIEGQDKNLTVCGIYSDVTNGGKTAKAVFTDNSADTMWCVIGAELSDKALVGVKVSEYGDRFDYAKISGIEDYITQTFGSTISSVGKASVAAMAVALIITVLVTLLFMKMLIAKDRYSIAVMKAFGFTNSDITAQYVARSVFVLIVGVVLGTLLANTLGEVLVGKVIASFGASSFKFVVNPLWAYLLCPLMMVGSVLIATMIGTSGAGKIKISENIKE